MKFSRSHSSRQRSALPVALLIAFWAAMGALFSYYYYLRALLSSQPSDPWLWALAGAMVWVFWAPATIFIRVVSKRFPLVEGRRVASLVYHVLFSLVTATVHVLWVVAVIPWPDILFGGASAGTAYANINWSDQLLSLRGPVDLLIYWAILLGVSGMNYYRKYLERDLFASKLETQLVESQLESLRMHIQPHFLFNTLHSIVSLIQQNNREAAIKMAVGLGDLLRGLLSERDRHEALLGEEINFLSRYLDIERMRFEDRLAIDIKISDEAKLAYVPVLLLQPLVENALRHGVAARTGPASIEINARKEDAFLIVEVYDKGEKSNVKQVAGQGMGLEITRERLRRMYRDDWELSLETDSNDNTCARVRIPFNNSPIFDKEESEIGKVD